MRNPWIINKWFDGVFILMPHYIGILLLVVFPGVFAQFNEHIPVWAWVALILCIDVAHVYSTFFRTYFDKAAWEQNSNTLLLIPFLCLVVSVIAYSVDAMLFWRLLAYAAVYHFIRQQYGFVRLYLSKSNAPDWSARFDSYTIYAFTIIPILIWHFSGPKNFNWFVENDFLYMQNIYLKQGLTIVFYAWVLAYLVKEAYLYVKLKEAQLPKMIFIIGTALSWFVGIVLLNGDLAFTFLNVVSHGIPYMALIWFYGERNYTDGQKHPFLSKVFSLKGIAVFVGMLLLLAFVEEGLWDGLVWKEHSQLFGIFNGLPQLTESPLIAIIIPLLALPQLTHYVLDGFIWKINTGNFYWKKLV